MATTGWLAGRRVVIDPDGVTWVASARGDEGNFDYSAPGPDAAVAGVLGTHAIPARIRRVLRAGSDTLVFETSEGVWVLTGNPHAGGCLGPAEPVAVSDHAGGLR